MMPMWNGGYSMTGWSGWPMAFWMVMIAIGLLVLVGLLIWAAARQYQAPATRDDATALRILRERYARGELDSATYDEMRERLEHAEPPVGAR